MKNLKGYIGIGPQARRYILLALALQVFGVVAWAQGVSPVPPTTPFSRYLLQATNGPDAAARIGVTGGGGTNAGITQLTGDTTAAGQGTVQATVTGINGQNLASLPTGLLKNVNGSGVPQIGVPGTDFLAPNGPLPVPQLTTNGMSPAPTAGQLMAWNGTAWVAVSAGAGTGNALTNNTAVQTFTGPNAFANPLNVYTGLGFLAANSVTNANYGILRFQTPAIANSEGEMDTLGGNVRTILPHSGGEVTYDNAGGNGVTSYMDAYGNPTQIIRKSFNFSGTAFLKLYNWSDPQGDLSAKYGYYGIPGTSESPYPLASASTMTDLPFDAKAKISAMPLPIITFASFVDIGINTNELAMTNIAAMLQTSGISTAISNAAPGTFYLQNDGNLFFNQTRDANGYLTINTGTGYFPDGTNFATILHNYGLKLGQTIYAYPLPTNQVSVSTLGAVVAPTTPLAQPAMSPSSAQADISKLYDFGVDLVRIADMGGETEGYYSLFTKKVADNIQHPQALAFSFPKLPYSVVTAQGGKNRLAPMALEMLYNYPGWTPPFAWQSVNNVENDQLGGWPGTAPAGGTNAIALMDVFRQNFILGGNNLGPGCYGDPLAYPNNSDLTQGDAQLLMAASAINLAPIHFAIDYHNNVLTTMPNCMTALTNATFLKVRYDSLVNRPYKVFDYGATNVSCYARRLNNNGFAVGLFNEIGAATNLTVNFAALGADPSATYSVTSAWDTNWNFGNYTGSFTYTNVPADGSELLVLTPVPSTAPASQFMGYSTNATRTAKAVPVDTNTNSPYGAPNFMDSPVTIDPVTGNIVTPGTVTSAGSGGGSPINSFSGGDNSVRTYTGGGASRYFPLTGLAGSSSSPGPFGTLSINSTSFWITNVVESAQTAAVGATSVSRICLFENGIFLTNWDMTGTAAIGQLTNFLYGCHITNHNPTNQYTMQGTNTANGVTSGSFVLGYSYAITVP